MPHRAGLQLPHRARGQTHPPREHVDECLPSNHRSRADRCGVYAALRRGCDHSPGGSRHPANPPRFLHPRGGLPDGRGPGPHGGDDGDAVRRRPRRTRRRSVPQHRQPFRSQEAARPSAAMEQRPGAAAGQPQVHRAILHRNQLPVVRAQRAAGKLTLPSKRLQAAAMMLAVVMLLVVAEQTAARGCRPRHSSQTSPPVSGLPDEQQRRAWRAVAPGGLAAVRTLVPVPPRAIRQGRPRGLCARSLGEWFPGVKRVSGRRERPRHFVEYRKRPRC